MTLVFSAGTSDFAELQETPGVHFVDKSLFVKEALLETDKAILISRPRRFGKTLNMSMLYQFLSNSNSRPWFEKLKIHQYPEIMAELGQHPTIFLSFKDAKQQSFKEAKEHLTETMSKVFRQFSFLKENLMPHEQANFDRILNKKPRGFELNQSLASLSQWLSEYSQKRVWVLLDEYDAPIHSAWQYGYYKNMVAFMQGFLGAAFKDNSYLHRGVMTGILRVSRENIFSGLNNVSVYSMLHPKYGEYFGFTDPEVDLICELGDLQAQRENIRTWYNGYQIRNIQLYNPWSIVKYCTDREFKPYWVNTSSNVLVKKIIAGSGGDIKEKFEQLMQGLSIIIDIDEHSVLPGVEGNETSAIWSFLLFSGYLKVISQELGSGTSYKVTVAIPNQEIARLYDAQLSQLFGPNFSPNEYLETLRALTEGHVSQFEDYLQNYLETSMSYLDAGTKKPERFYHGFVLGLLVALKETYEVRSNRESGFGLYDVMMTPKDPSKLGIIMEFKVTKSKKLLNLEAQKALDQIDARNYQAELEARGIKKILKLGIVFFGKKVLVKAGFNLNNFKTLSQLSPR